MATKGGFGNMFDKMIAEMGRDESLRMAILFNDAGEDYILAGADEATKIMRLDVDGEIRVVLAVTYTELRRILKPRQSELFEKVTKIVSGKQKE